jgi:hypothetical protein
MSSNDDRFKHAIAAIDDANREDPNRETFEGTQYAKELLYSERMSHWLDRVEPGASDALKLAARAQHIRRWTSPRSDYPQGKRGYYQWRTSLYRFHADEAEKILVEVGYGAETIDRVKSLLRKEKIKQDPEMQLLEDVICLVFLQSYFSDFARQHDEAKMITIIRKTWRKMSDRGHEVALQLELSDGDKALIEKALG